MPRLSIKVFFDNIEEYLLTFALGSMVIYIFIQIILRYIFNLPLAWSEELARFTFVWLIYLGASMAVKRQRHLRVDAALLMFPKRVRPFIMLIGDLLFLFFALVIIKETATLTYIVSFVRRQVSPALQISMGLAYLAVPVSFSLMAIRLCQNIIKFVQENIMNRLETGKVAREHQEELTGRE
ncbi:MAG TPA: TRAP transporter small permease [Synergistaceae bacterium]|nr:TRAP transporter small permease [Synergistaceae bacterium]